MERRARLLFVDLEPANVSGAIDELMREGFTIEHRIATIAELADALKERWSAVVASPLSNGETLRIVRAQNADVPYLRFSANLVHELREAQLRTEAKRLTRALEESDRQYRLAFLNAPIGIAHADVDGNLLIANPRFCEIIGHPFPEIAGRHFNTFSHPDDAQRVRQFHDDVVAGTRASVRYERRYIRKDGTSVWASVTLAPVAERGNVVYVMALVEDIDERKRAEEELHVRAIQQSAIAELGLLALRKLDQSVLDRACELVRTGLGVESSLFISLEEDGRTMRDRAGNIRTNMPVANVDETTHAGSTILAGEPVVIEDYSVDGRMPRNERALAHGVAGGVMVPVASGARKFGVLSAHTKHVRPYHPADVHFMQSLANILADAFERERGRAALAESEERYREVVEGASEVIFTTDAQGRFLSLNAAFEKITGFKREDWIGRSSGELIATVDGVKGTSLISTVVKDQIPQSNEIWVAARDRNVLADIAAVPKIENGRTVAVFGFARDITETRRARHERQQLARNLELLLQSTIEGIFTLDVEGNCRMVNRAAAEMLGYAPEALLGHHLHDFVHDGNESACLILNAIRSGAASVVTSDSFRRADGSTFPVEYSAAPIVEHDTVIGVVVNFTDVTDRRKLESQLEQAGRLTSLGRLAATIAHEFNNVLMGISPFVEVLRRGTTPEKAASALEHVGNAIKRGKRITDEILRFTQPADPVKVRIAVDSWLRGVESEARSYLDPSKYAIALMIEDTGLAVAGDPNQLHQVFANLIVNARDAMPDGGPIIIAARHESPGTRFRYGVVESPQRYAHFVVQDSGIGMKPETLRHIFEPLFTTKKNGTGLGLAVSHQVIARHGGHVFVESEPGAGTSFHLFIPLMETVEAKRTRVLLVEDEQPVASGIAALLEIEGMEVEIAGNGAEAIEIGARWSADVIVMDVGLPDFSGPEAYRRMETEVPVIFATGDPHDERFADILGRVGVSVLIKPFEIGDLSAAIRKAVRP
ncbi:MAG TPA: PAS domain S-box protein [Thermoanaerobaculia bacterium]|nr:PAS domain S-box protein [Thermoanaerobaculia bacterium]